MTQQESFNLFVLYAELNAEIVNAIIKNPTIPAVGVLTSESGWILTNLLYKINGRPVRKAAINFE